MPTPSKEWTVRIAELLCSRPRPFDYVIAQAAAVVPPGRAYREAERLQEWSREKRGNEPRTTLDQSRQLRVELALGARSIVRKAIYSAKKSGYIEEYFEDDVRMLRLTEKPWRLLQ